MRMGTFHTICTFIAAVGKRFGEAGLVDVLVESGVVGSRSVVGVLEGALEGDLSWAFWRAFSTELYECTRYKQ